MSIIVNWNGTPYTLPTAGETNWGPAVTSFFSDLGNNGTTLNTTQTLSNKTVKFAMGSAGSPSITFASDSTTGFYQPTAGRLALTTSGVQRLLVDGSGNITFTGNVFTSGYSFTSSSPAVLAPDGSNNVIIQAPLGKSIIAAAYEGSAQLQINSTSIVASGTNLQSGDNSSNVATTAFVSSATGSSTWTPQLHQGSGGTNSGHQLLWADQNLHVQNDGMWILCRDQSLYTKIQITGTPTTGESPGVIWTVANTVIHVNYTVQSSDTTDQAVALGLANAIASNTGLTTALANFKGADGIGYLAFQTGYANQTSGGSIYLDQPWAASGNSLVANSSTHITVSIGSPLGGSTPKMDGNPILTMTRYVAGYQPSANDQGPIIYFQGQKTTSGYTQIGAISMLYTGDGSSTFGTQMLFNAADDTGTSQNVVAIGKGLYMYSGGSPVIGDKGAGSISANNMYANNFYLANTTPAVLGLDGSNNVVMQTGSGKTLTLAAYTGATQLQVSNTAVSITGGGLSVTGGINSTDIGGTTPSTGAFTTLSASSTVSGSGFSTYLASPPAIGGTTPSTGAFTTLSASSTVSGSGFSTYLASPPAIGGTIANTGKFSALTLTGDLISGNNAYLSGGYLVVGSASSANIFSSFGAGLAFQSASLQNQVIEHLTNTGTLRWQIGKDNSAETGSNAGSNYYWNAYTDGGAFLSTPISIGRATGTVAMGSVAINGGAINGTAIGATTASTGAFTTLSTTGQITVNNGSAALIELIGGGATPNKYLRSYNGSFGIVNSAYTTAILTLTDGGNLFTQGGIDGTAIGATTPASGAFTTLSSNTTSTSISTQTSATYTVGALDATLILNPSVAQVLVLPTASSYTGRILTLKLIAAHAVTSSASNVVPLAGGSASTAILTGTAGKFAVLQSDGSNWQITMAN